MPVDTVLGPVQSVSEGVEEGIASFLERQESDSSDVVLYQFTLDEEIIKLMIKIFQEFIPNFLRQCRSL